MKILVVDDHAYNRELLGFILEDQGHEPIFAENGKHAVDQVLEDTSIDLVLMDVMMPVMDGLEATRQIKSSCIDRFIPVLFVTALDDDKNITACLESGGDDFVPKPITESVLLAKLNAHARSKKLYDNLKTVNEELTYHRKMVDREHAIVDHIYKNAHDRVKSTCDNMHIYTSPMSMFNGDLVLFAPSPSGGLYCLVGDFTGHGLAASIGSLPVTEIFFQNVRHQASISHLAEEINHRLKVLLPSNMFFCAAIFDVNPAGSKMNLWLGGMNDVLLVSKDASSIERIPSAYMPLGILSDEEFDSSPKIIPLEQGERCYIYTDGITEAHNSDHEEYGQDKLENVIQSVAVETVETLIESVNQFSGDKEQTDDITIVEFLPGKIVHRSKLDGQVIDVGVEYHKVESIPWVLDIILKDDDLKSTSVVDQVMNLISSIKGIELHQNNIFTLVSELYNNSLEHGVLRLSSDLKSTADGFEKYYKLRQSRLAELKGEIITVKCRYEKGEPNRLILSLSDSGDGFDIEAAHQASVEDANSHGRGIDLIDSLCSAIEYSDGGRTVTAVYDLCQH